MEHIYSVLQSDDVWFVEEENTLPPWLKHPVYKTNNKEDAIKKCREFERKDLTFEYS